MTTEPLKPRVFEGEARTAPPPTTPQVVVSERTDRIVPAWPAAPPIPAPKERKNRTVSYAFAALGVSDPAAYAAASPR